MRITVDIDDQLLDQAGKISGTSDIAALVHAGLRSLIERESMRRLAELGGSEHRLERIPRRRPQLD